MKCGVVNLVLIESFDENSPRTYFCPIGDTIH